MRQRNLTLPEISTPSVKFFNVATIVTS